LTHQAGEEFGSLFPNPYVDRDIKKKFPYNIF